MRNYGSMEQSTVPEYRILDRRIGEKHAVEYQIKVKAKKWQKIIVKIYKNYSS